MNKRDFLFRSHKITYEGLKFKLDKFTKHEPISQLAEKGTSIKSVNFCLPAAEGLSPAYESLRNTLLVMDRDEVLKERDLSLT